MHAGPRHTVPLPEVAGPVWPHVARIARGWLAEHGIAVRDALLLLPFAALLAPARAAFATGGGWMPRIETPLTLAATLAPPRQPEPLAWSGDTVLDRLNAAVLLRQQSWGFDDQRLRDHMAAALVDAAGAFAAAAVARPPGQRAAWFDTARAALPLPAGPAAHEAMLLQIALTWAAHSVDDDDPLHAHRPAARIVVRVGGADARAEALLDAGGVPSLLIDADVAAASGNPGRWLCDGAEDEAHAAAAHVIDALNAGRTPVALLALDRVLVRRVRALLERQRVPLIDETGWLLSTTHAAARLTALLAAAEPAATADARLEWLKTWPVARSQPWALQALEAAWRARRQPGPAAAVLWDDARAFLAPLADARERSLSAWLALLRDRSGGDPGSDPAAEQVWRALRADDSSAGWRHAADGTVLTRAGFAAWIAATLESGPFVPPPAAGAEVVLTPLARAIGRDFGHVVAPGADALHLGQVDPAPGLIGEALARRLGLEVAAAARRTRQRLAFRQLLRAPALTLLRRRADGDEAVAPSPEVEALALEAALAGTPLAAERRWQPQRAAIAAEPVPRPAPAAGVALPVAISATAVGALRACPYRWYALHVLKLSEPDEIDLPLAKRDYGTWLHAVLHRWHGAGGAMTLPEAADAITAEHGLAPSEMLPFRAAFDALLPAYERWHAARSAAGHVFVAGEVQRALAPPGWAPQTLVGRIDRIDRGPDGTLEVIDYKTVGWKTLKDQLADPLEDTQLAYYAALEPDATRACYLALDATGAPTAVPHPSVAEGAAMLLDRVGDELRRIRDGAPLPALGEGDACEFCAARGLCRRDHWTA